MHPELDAGAVEGALFADFVSRISSRGRIVGLPAGLLPSCPARLEIHSRPIQDRIQPGAVGIRNFCRDECAAPTNAFGVNFSVFLRHACLRQRANETAGRCTSGRTHSRSRKPASGNDGAETRNGQQP